MSRITPSRLPSLSLGRTYIETAQLADSGKKLNTISHFVLLVEAATVPNRSCPKLDASPRLGYQCRYRSIAQSTTLTVVVWLQLAYIGQSAAAVQYQRPSHARFARKVTHFRGSFSASLFAAGSPGHFFGNTANLADHHARTCTCCQVRRLDHTLIVFSLQQVATL